MGQLSGERAETVRFTKLNHSSFYHIIIFRFPLLPASRFTKQNESQSSINISSLSSRICYRRHGTEVAEIASKYLIDDITKDITSPRASCEVMNAINDRQMREKFSRYATSSSDTPAAEELQLGNRYFFIRDGTKKRMKMMRLHL